MSLDMCRLCLSSNNLQPIFKDLSRSERYSIVLSLTTGLKIKLNDGLPQSVCTECTELVNSALNLRNQSHTSEIQLLKLGYKQNYPLKPENIPKKRTKKKKILNNEIDSVLTQNYSYEDFNKIENDLSTDNRISSVEVSIEVTEVKEEKQDGGLDFDFSEAKDNFVEPEKIKSELKNEKGLSRKEKRELYLSLVEGELDPNGPVKCKICKKTVNKWASFRTHTKLHLGFKFVCEFCGKSFVSSTQLNRHCRSHHGMKRELGCTHCDYMALDNSQLILHERRYHTGERPFVCDLCAASYFSRKCLIQHIENHSTVKSIQCEKCPQMFKSRRHLARHMYSSHTSKEFTYKCPICHQIYRNFKYIRVHLRKLHGLTAKDVQIVKIKL